jgi:hypothetical protein
VLLSVAGDSAELGSDVPQLSERWANNPESSGSKTGGLESIL